MVKGCFKSRLTAFVLCIMVALSVVMSTRNATVYADNATKEITVFSVEDYICEADPEDPESVSVLEMFEEETGVSVNYVTFSTNEEMYNELLKDPYACDLMCPSEYMIMKLISEGLIREFDTPSNVTEYGSKYINDVFKGLKVENQNGETVSIMSEDESKSYAVGYMWGTVGLIYNMNTPDGRTLTDENFKSWTSIWNDFHKRVTIKDSIRDSYFIALAYVYQDELLEAKTAFENGDGSQESADEYNAKLTEIFNRTDAKSVAKVEDALFELKENLYAFEVDAGKADILTGKIDVNLAWSGDAVYALEQGLYDEEGNDLENKIYLGYAVPEEGSNVWFDGYVMTKNADYSSAHKFLDFIARPDVAVLNMDYTGYTSCVAGNAENTEVFDYVLDSYGDEEGTTRDLSYFFDPDGTTGIDYTITVSDELLPMFTAQYPTEEIIQRCAVMQNFSGDELTRINDMWKRIKLITLSDTAIWTILGVSGAVAIGACLFIFREKIFAKWYDREKKDKKRKYKVVKIEKV